jgi:AI-2 transport protein TqsA
MGLRAPGDALKAAAASVVVIAGLKLGAPLLVPLLLAGCLAAVSAPLALWARARGAPAWAGAALAVLVDLAVLGVVVLLLVASVNELQEMLPEYSARLREASAATSGWLRSKSIHVSPGTLARVADPAALMGVVGSTLTGVAAVLTELVLVLLVVFFVLFEVTIFHEKLRLILRDPDAGLERLTQIVRELQRYLLVKSGLSVVTGVLSGLLLSALGVHFAVVLALVAFFLNYIPNLGLLIALVPAASIALIDQGPGAAAAVVGGYLLIHLIVGQLIEPRLLGYAMGLSPLVVLLSMIFWGWLWGPAGALLSVPLTMSLKIVVTREDQTGWGAVLLGPATGAPAPGGSPLP